MFVCDRKEADLEEKKYELNEYFPCLSTTSFINNLQEENCEKVIKIECMTDLKTVHELSKDDDIERISGTASLGSF